MISVIDRILNINFLIKKHFYFLICFLMLLLAFVKFFFPVILNIKLFTEKFKPKIYEEKYNKSQYVIPQSKTQISDGELLSYAGYRYAKGINPILINPEHPPLGKYFIGWFTLLTGNNRLVSLFFAVANLILVAMIIYFITKSLFCSLLGIVFMSFDTVFIDQIIYAPLLDIIQLFFLLLYFFFLFYWLKEEKFWKLIMMGISLGCMASTKIYFPVFFVIVSSIISLLKLNKRLQNIIIFLFVTTFFIIFVYTLSYLVYFLYGNSLRSFLGTQKWIFLFWKDNSVQASKFFGDALSLILFNRWKVWWGKKLYIQFEHWSFLWPLFFIIGFMIAIYILIRSERQKIGKKLFIESSICLSFWIILATIYLSLLPISPRYLMILFVPIYILIPLVGKLFVIKLKVKN